MGSKLRRLVALTLVASTLAGVRGASAADPPPPTDAELTKLIAIQEAVAKDPRASGDACAEDDAESDDLAAAGRRAEASPVVGPLLRRHALTGRRYVEVSWHVAAVLLGAAIADAADAPDTKKGKPGRNRAALMASSPAAPPILARQAELTKAMAKVQALCEDEEDEEESEE
jgi:hypothetical protein